MSELNRFYQTETVGTDIWIRPTAEAIQERQVPSWPLFLILSLGPIVVWSIFEGRVTPTILICGLWPLPILLLMEMGNRGLGKKGKLPLIIQQDQSIWYQDKCLLPSARVNRQATDRQVSVWRHLDFDNDRSYDVRIADAEGQFPDLPFPFFSRLSAIEAAILAQLLASSLALPLINEIQSESKS